MEWTAEQARTRWLAGKKGFENANVFGGWWAWEHWRDNSALTDMGEALTRLAQAEAERDRLDSESRRVAVANLETHLRQLAVIDRLKAAVRREHERGNTLEAWMERTGDLWHDKWQQAARERDAALARAEALEQERDAATDKHTAREANVLNLRMLNTALARMYRKMRDSRDAARARLAEAEAVIAWYASEAVWEPFWDMPGGDLCIEAEVDAGARARAYQQRWADHTPTTTN